MIVRGRRVTKAERQAQLLLLLKRLWDLPLSGAQDLTGYGDASLPRIHSLLEEARRRDMVDCIRAGQTFQMQNRYYLHQEGIRRVQESFGLPMNWQVTEMALRQHVRRQRLCEPVARLMPILFRSGAVRTPAALAVEPGDDPHEIVLDESVALDSFTWNRDILRSPIHGLARFRTTGGDLVYLPIITVGLHHGDIPSPCELTEMFSNLDTSPDFHYGLTPASPPGILFVVLDRLAGLAVRLRVPRRLPIGIVDAEGHVVMRLDPVPPMGKVLQPRTAPDSVGAPETLKDWFHAEASLSTVQGISRRRVFEWVNSFPGSAQKDIASGIGHPPSMVKEILRLFGDVGLVTEQEKRPDLDRGGRSLAGRRDRQHPNIVHSRFGIYTNRESAYRKNQRDHDHGVARLAALFKRAGIQAEAGWRLEIVDPDGSQLKPDLWVLIPSTDGTAMWHALEFERSARAESQVIRKLRPYRRAMGKGNPWPLLMICGKGKPGDKANTEDQSTARTFVRHGVDLPMLVMTAREAFSGRLVLPGDTWRHMGGRVPITYLIDTVVRPDLLERVDIPPCWAQIGSANAESSSDMGQQSG